jgi:hypothetical protein
MLNLKKDEVAFRVFSEEEIAEQNIPSVDKDMVITKIEKIGSGLKYKNEHSEGKIVYLDKKFLNAGTEFVENGIKFVIVHGPSIYVMLLEGDRITRLHLFSAILENIHTEN